MSTQSTSGITYNPISFDGGNYQRSFSVSAPGKVASAEVGIRANGTISVNLAAKSPWKVVDKLEFRGSYDTNNGNWTGTLGGGWDLKSYTGGIANKIASFNVGPLGKVLPEGALGTIGAVVNSLDASAAIGLGLYGSSSSLGDLGSYSAQGIMAQGQFTLKIPLAEWGPGGFGIKVQDAARFSFQARLDFNDIPTIGDGLDAMGRAVSFFYGSDAFVQDQARNPHNLARDSFPTPPVRRDPIVIDLNGDGISLTSLAGSTVHFDLDANGFAERTAWLSPTDALLVRDINGNGIIDDGSELFGTPTTNGFDVLAALDSDGNGLINASDPEYANLKIWQDLNQDGISQSTELTSLADAGIVSISVRPSVSSYGPWLSGSQASSGSALRPGVHITSSGSTSNS